MVLWCFPLIYYSCPTDDWYYDSPVQLLSGLGAHWQRYAPLFGRTLARPGLHLREEGVPPARHCPQHHCVRLQLFQSLWIWRLHQHLLPARSVIVHTACSYCGLLWKCWHFGFCCIVIITHRIFLSFCKLLYKTCIIRLQNNWLKLKIGNWILTEHCIFLLI